MVWRELHATCGLVNAYTWKQEQEFWLSLPVPPATLDLLPRRRSTSRADTTELASRWGCSFPVFCSVTSELSRAHRIRKGLLDECLASLILIVVHDICGLFLTSSGLGFLDCPSVLLPVVIQVIVMGGMLHQNQYDLTKLMWVEHPAKAPLAPQL